TSSAIDSRPSRSYTRIAPSRVPVTTTGPRGNDPTAIHVAVPVAATAESSSETDSRAQDCSEFSPAAMTIGPAFASTVTVAADVGAFSLAPDVEGTVRRQCAHRAWQQGTSNGST